MEKIIKQLGNLHELHIKDAIEKAIPIIQQNTAKEIFDVIEECNPLFMHLDHSKKLKPLMKKYKYKE